MAARKPVASETLLKDAMETLNKELGDGTVMLMSEDPATTIEVVPTGILTLDMELGCGGYPRGRIVEVFGDPSVGKSTLALQGVASFQKHGHKVLYVDTENALDKAYSSLLGVDVDAMILSQPDCAEDAFKVIEDLVTTGAIGLVVVDSVATLVPRAEIEGEFGDANVGLHARLMSKAMRKLVGVLSRTHTASIWINQQRTNIGVMYGNPNVTTGGKALPYYASVRIEILKGEAQRTDGKISSYRPKIKIPKNKCGRPFGECSADLDYGIGFSHEGCLLDLGLARDIIKQSGAWFTFEGEQVGQGRVKAKTFLRGHPDEAEEIEKRIRNAAGNQ